MLLTDGPRLSVELTQTMSGWLMGKGGKIENATDEHRQIQSVRLDRTTGS